MSDSDVPNVAKVEPGGRPPTPPSVATVRLATVGFVDVFEHGVEGVDPVTRAGTDVPSNRAPLVRQAAADAGVNLQEL